MKQNVLFFGAHPDDIELGCGGTVAKLTRAGYSVTFVCFTSGEEGGSGISKERLATTREKEATRAAACLGVSDVRFLRFPDGLAASTKEMKLLTTKLVRELQPEKVFTHSTTDAFPDHKIFSALTLAAITAAGGPWYPELSAPPHAVAEIYGYEVWHPLNTFEMAIDVTHEFPKKLESLRCHESQIASVNYLAAAEGLASYRGALSMGGRFVEVYEVIRTQFQGHFEPGNI